jgi:hypothetical protein
MLIARVVDNSDPGVMPELYRGLVSGLSVLDHVRLAGFYELRGRGVRAREIVTLIDEDGNPLEDFIELPTRGKPDDGRNDVITRLRAKVVGLFPEDLGDHTYLDKAVAWIEVDGNFVGREVSLMGQPANGDTVTVQFEDVPLGFDLETGRSYEVDVVAKLQGRSEDSESRYSVILYSPNPDCFWTAVQTGPGSVRRRSSGTIHVGRHPAGSGEIDLAPQRDSPLAGAQIYFESWPLKEGVHTLQSSPGFEGTAWMVAYVPESAHNPGVAGTVWITTAESERVEGRFDVEVAELWGQMVHLTGEFGWKAGCRTAR